MPAERGWRRALRSLSAALRALLAAPRRCAQGALFEERWAEQRARELLVQCLSPAQREEFERWRGFTVRGGTSGRRYRITYGTTANIDVLTASGDVDYRLCARPLGLPTTSVMLTQKLMLETREPEFLRIAAKHAAIAGLQPEWREPWTPAAFGRD